MSNHSAQFEQTIAQKLQASRAAHLQYQYAKRQQQPATARQHLEQAAQFRSEADGLDPLHEAPAWLDEQATHPHDDLMTFYAKQLAK